MIHIPPQDPGTPPMCANGDLKNLDSCWKMYMARPYDDPYEHLLEYGITHDIP